MSDDNSILLKKLLKIFLISPLSLSESAQKECIEYIEEKIKESQQSDNYSTKTPSSKSKSSTDTPTNKTPIIKTPIIKTPTIEYPASSTNNGGKNKNKNKGN